MFFACIFVPDFPVEAILRSEPELRSRAVAVLDGKPPLQKVFAQNEIASRAGVQPGMTKLELEACSHIVLRGRSPLQEAAAHSALLDCAQSFSPRVEEVEDDTVVIDLAGLEPLFGPLPKIARDVARRASDLGLESNVAVASNSDTAVIAARGFSGVTLIAQGKEAQQLGGLPIEVLFHGKQGSQIYEHEREAEQVLDTLNRWGVRTLRSLAALPEVALSERLGQQGIRLQMLARGAAFRNMTPVEPPLVFEEAIELEHPLVLLEPLAFLLGRLLEQICARLSARALATQELQLRLELDSSCGDEETGTGQSIEHHSIFERTLRLPVPLLDAKIFLKLLQLDLNAHPPGAPILRIYLRAEPVRPRAAQGGLFHPPLPEPEKLELTLARIAGIVGENKIGSLQLLDTYRAEGFRMQRFAPRADENISKLNSTVAGAVTALRIFRPLVAVTVTLREGCPARIGCSQRKDIQGEVLWSAGPWRSSGDWWEQESWSRDEWDIAVRGETEITLYRLVRDLLAGKWFLEGTYD
jgi:protein ImuB